jgi:hypothetical protein
MTPESQNNLLLVNDSINIFQEKRTRATIGERRFPGSAPHSLLSSGAVNIYAAVNQREKLEEAVFSTGAALRLLCKGSQAAEREN